MDGKEKEPAAVKEPVTVKEKGPDAVASLLAAADLLDKQKGSHSEKHYRMLAADVRALAARVD